MIKRIKIQEKRTMTREEFITLSKDHILYLDGATGSNLVKAGMPSGVCPEQWILEHQDVMLQLQKDYVQAGTNILYAPTFTANRVKLAEYHLEKNMTSMIRDLVAISKKAAESTPGHPVYVAGDLTMTGEQLKPMGKMNLETLIDIYKEQILCLVDAGADLLVVETMMSLAETRAALIAAKEVCDLPVIATLTFEADGRTLFGTDAKPAAIVLESLGASAIGANCSTGPAQMENIISEMVSHTRIPVIAKPNAGLPFLDENGTTCYNMEAEEFAEEMEVLVNAGATILGGCCGTTPEFIRQIHERFGTDAKVAASRRPDGIRYLTSERITHSFGLDDGFFVVGERINPTGKKALQAQLREGSFEKVIQFAEEQEACGAKVLDINMGMSGIDEKASMLRALEEVSGVTNLPLSLDSSYVEVLEAALRNYPGRALVNSVSLETEKFEKLLPIVAKYGAMFILLPLSDAGLPKDIEEKKEIIHKIYDRALSLGMCKEDIVVDGLVATVGANPKAALETLETIRYCKENGFATICGLSNISFAMPERSFVNTAFLTLAIQAGLTMAIANPSQELLMSCALAADLLLNKEEAALRYIEYAGGVRERREEKEAELAKKEEPKPEAAKPQPKQPKQPEAPKAEPKAEQAKPAQNAQPKAAQPKPVQQEKRNDKRNDNKQAEKRSEKRVTMQELASETGIKEPVATEQVKVDRAQVSVDTRTVDVNVDKFSARYDDLADSRNMPSKRKNAPTGKKEKFNNRNNRRGQQFGRRVGIQIPLQSRRAVEIQKSLSLRKPQRQQAQAAGLIAPVERADLGEQRRLVLARAGKEAAGLDPGERRRGLPDHKLL